MTAPAYCLAAVQEGKTQTKPSGLAELRSQRSEIREAKAGRSCGQRGGSDRERGRALEIFRRAHHQSLADY